MSELEAMKQALVEGLVQHIESCQMTRRPAAKAAGVSLGTIGTLMRGNGMELRTEILLKMASQLGLSPQVALKSGSRVEPQDLITYGPAIKQLASELCDIRDEQMLENPQGTEVEVTMSPEEIELLAVVANAIHLEENSNV